MDAKFLEEYTAALNRATKIAEVLHEKQILVDDVDDHLIREFEQANAEVDRLSNQLLSINKQQN